MASPEQLLVSSIIRCSDMAEALAQHITTDMFHAYPDEWEWLVNYYRKYRKTPSKGAFKDAFPQFKIRTVEDTAHFANEVRKAHAKRMLIAKANEQAELIAKGDIDGAVKLMGSSAVQVAASLGTLDDADIFDSYEDIIGDVTRRVSRVRETGSAGILTGFPTLDKRTGGPQPGDFWVVGARLGEGKSWTMQKMATAAVMAGYNVQFDALEMSKASVGMRIHTMLSSQMGREIFRTTDLMQGKNFDLLKYKRFVRQLKKELDGRLHISDQTRGRVGLMTVASQIERNQPDIVFIDYITLMDKKGGEWQDVAALSSGILSLANEYKIPIVGASQLNRSHGLTGNKNLEPAGPEALSQSDAIGQDATAIITIKQTSTATMTMKMAKNRNGPSNFKWYCHFDPDHGVFSEVDYQDMLTLRDEARTAVDDED